MMNGWIAQNPDQHFAIRQFCPARIEQETLLQQEVQVCPNVFDEMPQLTSSEVDDIFDAFFDVECYEKDNVDKFEEGEEEEEEEEIVTFDQEDASTMMTDDPMVVQGGRGLTDDRGFYNVDQGLQLVHLLLACAEAVSCRDARLTDTMLSQIWPCVGPWGNSLQRVSHCFALGLKARLALLQNVNLNGSFGNSGGDVSLITREERVQVLALLHQATPYIAFGFLAANDTICQGASGKESLHIVDLGMEHTLQWRSLVRTMASRREGSRQSIRVTGVIGDCDPSEFESSIKGVYDEAVSLGVCIEFNMVPEPVSPLTLTPEKLELRDGEALFVNSMMHLHKHVKESRGTLKTILQSIKKLSPSLLIIVEQDANHNGPFFLSRFLESLHYYSAIFDSLDASLPRTCPGRAKIEKLHFAEEIRNVVAYEGEDRVERHERADQWRRQLGRAGFQVVGLKCLEEARVMVSEYGCDGYTVGSEKGCLQLGWKGRPIMLASAWQLNNVAASCS